ncbi:MAG: translation initiation factor IF-2, partial [Dehalococcoidia bacterium]
MAARSTNAGAGETAERGGASTRQAGGVAVRKTSGPVLAIPAAISVKRLAELMRASNIEVIKQLMRRGIMANINQVIDFETASTIASDFGFRPSLSDEPKTTPTTQKPDTSPAPPEEEDTSLLQPRAPVVTILGHVDHGKTTLLDVIRRSSITSSEKGGITQHIGAYHVPVNDKQITFLDTPGHEAFTAMRARGTQVTDIAVLVIAADDGVMPQTREAIDHAKAAGVPIVVAINKIDMPAANVDRVKQQLTELNLVPEDWGGDTIVVPVSAKTEEGIPDLLENILLVAEIAELKVNPDRKAQGVVVEAKLDATRGAVATVLVQSGTLHVGDNFLVGNCRGKVRALFDDQGRRIQSAGPTIPVEVLGIESVPRAGDLLSVEESGRKPRSSVERERQRREAEVGQGNNSTDIGSLLAQVRAGDTKEFNIILKTDVEGSSEAIRSAVEGLGNDEVIVKIIRTNSGVVTESDILLAAASNATVMAFNTRA